MEGKKLEAGCHLESADANGDGVITENELSNHQKMLEIEDQDAMRDAQRKMAWFALFGMLLYPFAVVIASMADLDNAAKILGDMAPTYFVSVAAIVAAFYGKEALTNKK